MREDIYSYLKMHLSLLTADIHTLLPRFRSDLSEVFNYRSNIPYLQKKWRKSHAQSLSCHSRVVFGAESLKFGLMEGLLMANEKQDTFSSRCHLPGQQTVHYGPGCVKKWKNGKIWLFSACKSVNSSRMRLKMEGKVVFRAPWWAHKIWLQYLQNSSVQKQRRVEILLKKRVF